MVKCVIGIPTLGPVEYDTVKSVSKLQKHGIQITVKKESSRPVSVSRNLIVKYFLEETDADYHSKVLESIFNSFKDKEGKKVQAFPINEGLALIYAELAEKAFTGMGVSCLVPGTRIYTNKGIVPIETVQSGDEVITQPLTFVATCNAISYLKAKPVFVDVDKETLGLSPEKLEGFLEDNAIMKDDGFTYNKLTNKRITACVPMHTFGHPARIDKIKEVCDKFNIVLVEDAAESIGSKFKGKHVLMMRENNFFLKLDSGIQLNAFIKNFETGKTNWRNIRVIF